MFITSIWYQYMFVCRLGTSAEGTHLRARMQSACLLSDMEAFKAANPGCVLGDFVRWYSPRDWIEDTVINDDGTAQCTGWLSAATATAVTCCIFIFHITVNVVVGIIISK